jgi:hypothetical protein
MNAPRFAATVFLLVVVTFVGCGHHADLDRAAPTGDTPQGAGPQRIVAQFLEAVRTGDDKQAAGLLTPLARSKTEEMEMVVAPPGSETAHYEVLDVQLDGERAQVASHWADLDTDGLKHVDRIVWVLRKLPEGWRISGMLASAFADAEPIALNFEDPAEMLRKQRQAEEELARRHVQAMPAPRSSQGAAAPAVR